jgi:hypothetical protein
VSFDEDRSQVRTSNGPQALRRQARDPHRPLVTYKIA